MKKVLISTFFIGFLSTSLYARMQGDSVTFAHNRYYKEFKKLKEGEVYNIIFDKHANGEVKAILRDALTFSEVSAWQRLLCMFAMDNVLISSKTMPELYSYVHGLCTKHNIKMPLVFVTHEKGIFNAFAAKLLMSAGAIVIGQDVLKEASEGEVNAVVAHEIGHIKYNHVNKQLFVQLVFPPLAAITPKLIFGKSHEKQADEFSYKYTDNGKGLIMFFKRLIKKQQDRDNDLKKTNEILKKNKSRLNFDTYFYLKLRYYMTKALHNVNKAHSWLYHNTILGPHPSPEARIKRVQEYFALHSEC